MISVDYEDTFKLQKEKEIKFGGTEFNVESVL